MFEDTPCKGLGDIGSTKEGIAVLSEVCSQPEGEREAQTPACSAVSFHAWLT